MFSKEKRVLLSKKERRKKYNQTYYEKNRLKILKQWRDNFVSAKAAVSTANPPP